MLVVIEKMYLSDLLSTNQRKDHSYFGQSSFLRQKEQEKLKIEQINTVRNYADLTVKNVTEKINNDLVGGIVNFILDCWKEDDRNFGIRVSSLYDKLVETQLWSSNPNVDGHAGYTKTK